MLLCNVPPLQCWTSPSHRPTPHPTFPVCNPLNTRPDVLDTSILSKLCSNAVGRHPSPTPAPRCPIEKSDSLEAREPAGGRAETPAVPTPRDRGVTRTDGEKRVLTAASTGSRITISLPYACIGTQDAVCEQSFVLNELHYAQSESPGHRRSTQALFLALCRANVSWAHQRSRPERLC